MSFAPSMRLEQKRARLLTNGVPKQPLERTCEETVVQGRRGPFEAIVMSKNFEELSLRSI